VVEVILNEFTLTPCTLLNAKLKAEGTPEAYEFSAIL